MSEPVKVDLRIIMNGLTLMVDNVDVKVDVHGLNKSRAFWRLLSSTAPFWKIVEGQNKVYIRLEGLTSSDIANALKALARIRTLTRKETEELLKMPLEDMCRKLVLKAFIET